METDRTVDTNLMFEFLMIAVTAWTETWVTSSVRRGSNRAFAVTCCLLGSWESDRQRSETSRHVKLRSCDMSADKVTSQR